MISHSSSYQQTVYKVQKGVERSSSVSNGQVPMFRRRFPVPPRMGYAHRRPYPGPNIRKSIVAVVVVVVAPLTSFHVTTSPPLPPLYYYPEKMASAGPCSFTPTVHQIVHDVVNLMAKNCPLTRSLTAGPGKPGKPTMAKIARGGGGGTQLVGKFLIRDC